MSDEITLEVELDLPLDPEDIARYRAYIASGAGERDAAIQTAQDMLMLGAQGSSAAHCPADRMTAYATANEIAAKRGDAL